MKIHYYYYYYYYYYHTYKSICIIEMTEMFVWKF